MSKIWVRIGDAQIHLGCLEPEEASETLMFCNEDYEHAAEKCSRCGIPLKEVPDP